MHHSKHSKKPSSFRLRRTATEIALVVALTGCASRPSQAPAGETPQQSGARVTSQPQSGAVASAPRALETQQGAASFISEEFQGKKTASGEIYDASRLVAAHPTYPLGTLVRVTDVESGRTIEVRVIDRSSSGKEAGGPVIDLSRAAAEQLGITAKEGQARVKAEVIEWGSGQRAK